MTSSSTSSSETAEGTRRIFFKILLTILVGMAVAMGLVRLFVMANGAGSQSMLGRVLQAQAAIPQIAAEDGDLVLFYGSSMVEAGFSPREFDSELAARGVQTSSFNFGFGGLNPIFQDYLSRRIVEGFEAQDRRLKLIMVEFNPFQATLTRRAGAVALEDSYIALLASPGELLDILLEDPERGLRMLQIRYLRDGISAEMITTFFWGRPFQVPRPRTELVEEEGVEEQLDEVIEKLNEKFYEEYPDFDGSDWYYPWRGGGTIKAERSRETLAVVEQYYSLTQSAYNMDNDRLRRIATADIEELNFDPELVDAFIAMVKNLQGVADHVEIVLLPKNTDWIRNSPEALARQKSVLERIHQETGAPVRNFQEIAAVTNEMFSDTTHLNRYYGAALFTQHLVEQYTELLR